MPNTMLLSVPGSSVFANDGLTLRSQDGGQTWFKFVRVEVHLSGNSAGDVMKTLAEAFADKVDATFEVNTFTGDEGDGYVYTETETVVEGWVPATDDEVAKAQAFGQRR